MVQSHWPRPNGGLSRCRTWGVTVSRGMKQKGPQFLMVSPMWIDMVHDYDSCVDFWW